MHSPFFYSLQLSQLWSSMCITLCFMRKICYWELRDALVFSQPLVLLYSMNIRCRDSTEEVSLRAQHLKDVYFLSEQLCNSVLASIQWQGYHMSLIKEVSFCNRWRLLQSSTSSHIQQKSILIQVFILLI